MCAPGDTMDLGIPWRAPLLVFLLPLERRRRRRLSSSHRQRKEEEEEETINNIFLGIGKRGGEEKGGRGEAERQEESKHGFSSSSFLPAGKKGEGKVGRTAVRNWTNRFRLFRPFHVKCQGSVKRASGQVKWANSSPLLSCRI